MAHSEINSLENDRKTEIAPGSPLSKLALIGAILKDSGVPKSACKVAWFLIDSYNTRTRRCFPGYGKITKEANCDLKTAKAAIKTLTERGWLTYQRGGGAKANTNAYAPSWGRTEPVAKPPPVAGGQICRSDPTDPEGWRNDHHTGGEMTTPTGGEMTTQTDKDETIKINCTPSVSPPRMRAHTNLHSRNEAHERLISFITTEAPFAFDTLSEADLEDMIKSEALQKGAGIQSFGHWLREHPEAAEVMT